MDGNFKRLKYVRYADDFLIGIIGSKEDAVKIKDDIKRFLADRLALDVRGRTKTPKGIKEMKRL